MAFTLVLRGARTDDGGGVCWRVFFGVMLSLRLSLILAIAIQDCREGKGRCDAASGGEQDEVKGREKKEREETLHPAYLYRHRSQHEHDGEPGPCLPIPQLSRTF